MSKYKNNHYLSQFYLKGFMCNEKWTYFWDIKRQPNWNINKSDNYRRIEKVGYENYLFCIKNRDWTYDKSLEIEFSQKENEYKKLLEKIISSVKNIHKSEWYKLNSEEKLLLIDFLRFQFKRSLIIQNWLWECLVNKFENIINELYLSKKINKELYFNLTICSKENNDKSIHNTKVEMARNIFWNKEIWENIMNSKDLYIFYTSRKDKSFITSDFPIYRHNENGNNWILHNDTEIVFPLSSNVVILFYQKWDKQIYHCENDDKFINKVNWMILANADNLKISNNFELLKEMVQRKINWSEYLYPKNHYVSEIEKEPIGSYLEI